MHTRAIAGKNLDREPLLPRKWCMKVVKPQNLAVLIVQNNVTDWTLNP